MNESALRPSHVRLVPKVAHHKVRAFWNWLPAFLAVAESGAINATATACGTSPSALSRAVRLLEQAVGGQLFYRRRGRLVLTKKGERALAALQLATRLIEDAFVGDAPELEDERCRSEVRSVESAGVRSNE